MEISVQDRAVYEQLSKDYLNLKLLAQNACTSADRLERCKQLVRDDVHSRRKLGRVANFDDLLRLLEQRNLLSLLKLDLIERLELALDSEDVSNAIKSYRKTISTYYAAVRRFYLEDLRYRDRRTLLEKEVEKIKLSGKATGQVCASSGQYHQHRDTIYSLLQQEIGRDWKTFGRFLNVPAAELDAIEERNRNDLKTRIYEVLSFVEDKFTEDHVQFIHTLQKALECSRRKDLKRKIDNIIKI